MLKILPRRPSIADATTESAARAEPRPLARFIDGHAGGMPAPRRSTVSVGESDSGPMPSSPRPA